MVSEDQSLLKKKKRQKSHVSVSLCPSTRPVRVRVRVSACARECVQIEQTHDLLCPEFLIPGKECKKVTPLSHEI